MADNSPRILAVSFGRMEVEGLGVGSDFMLYPGGGRPWDWKQSDTHHKPGIRRADVEELLDRGAETIVLSRGMNLALHVAPETWQFLDSSPAAVFVGSTQDAVEAYNLLLASGRHVAGLFHSTC